MDMSVRGIAARDRHISYIVRKTMKNHLGNFKNCLQKEVPFCQAECPFHIDTLEFVEKLKRGSFKAAFKNYRNAVGFPDIVSHLCHAPCKQVCPRKDVDQAIDMSLLEKACLEHTKHTDPADYNLPKKKGKIAIIGAGISGLACALRLSTKKYDVSVYEKSDRIGGQLWGEMDPKVFLADIEKQFQFETYQLHLNTPINSLADLEDEGFNAIYIATGQSGEDFGLLHDSLDEPCLMKGDVGVFGGGCLLGKALIYAIADGLHMSTTIDNFLKTGNLIYTKPKNETSMCLEPSHLKKLAPVRPASENSFTKEEAIAEANRCIECQCDACRVHCDLTEFFNKWPLRIRDEIQATTMPGTAEVKATPAKRLISTCNQCGLCEETCPEDIDLGGLILAARKSMHQQKKAPWPFHDFWMRDMEFSNGKFASVVRSPKGSNDCKYAFFPGCQIGASDPTMVEKAYEYLIAKEPSTGLMLQCCGVPGEWSGDEEKFSHALKEVENGWKALGQPILVLACPTCNRTFAEHLPHIPRVFIYELMADWGIIPKKSEGTYSIFDPCSTRGMDGLRNSVRTIAKATGANLDPILWQEAHSHCCGYGGQIAIANPEFADFVVKKRISEGSHPYITYCINCRDNFLGEGKDAIHILDMVFGGESKSKLPTVTERRDNRMLLKESILKKHWGETMTPKESKYDFQLILSDEMEEKLNKQRILKDEVCNVIDFCETCGRSVYNKSKNTYSGYRQIGYMTYWVEYQKANNTFTLVNAYNHRMKIELEVVWNGKKTDLTVQ